MQNITANVIYCENNERKWWSRSSVENEVCDCDLSHLFINSLRCWESH